MAEPTNTPMPASTPVPGGTPRSASPAPAAASFSSSSYLSSLAPAPPAPARVTEALAAVPSSGKPVVLHIGDPIRYNPETYAAFSTAFDVIRPPTPDRQRPEFVKALRERRWGDFHAIFRPFWGTGGEMGRWDAELIDLLPDSVRIFASAGAGFDWADTKLLGDRGILYCNSGLAAAEAVADFAVSMIISTFRHLPWCVGAATLPYLNTAADGNEAEAEAHRIFKACHAQATGASHHLRGHSLGLIGLGNIGRHIAAKLGCAAFGMKIHYFDVARKPPAVEAELGAVFYDTLDGLLASSDCVVLCTPALPDGQPLITAAALARFRPGARFVNVARGSLVDEDALADALDRGHLSAVALDVHAHEPRVHPRLLAAATRLDGPAPGRVMLTCHNAGGTVETHAGFEELSMRNIMAVLQGREAITPVNLDRLKSR